MEKKGARLFQRESNALEHGSIIVELVVLESRRQLRLEVNKLIRLAKNSTVSTDEMQQHLFLCVARFGTLLSIQLLRSLHHEDIHKRQSIVWLLILLNDKETILPLQLISQDKRMPRPIRLSASMALAGMGATPESLENHRCTRLYAISSC
jgi:hypothetical protein